MRKFSAPSLKILAISLFTADSSSDKDMNSFNASDAINRTQSAPATGSGPSSQKASQRTTRSGVARVSRWAGPDYDVVEYVRQMETGHRPPRTGTEQ